MWVGVDHDGGFDGQLARSATAAAGQSTVGEVQ